MFGDDFNRHFLIAFVCDCYSKVPVFRKRQNIKAKWGRANANPKRPKRGDADSRSLQSRSRRHPGMPLFIELEIDPRR